jgi:A118 family predicted phage portal protein
VFLDEGMLKGKRGDLTVPFDVKKRLFVNIDKGLGDSSKHIDEYNPSLRSEENLRSLSTALSALGLRAGFGAEHWKLDRITGSIQTATATMMNRQDMVLTFKRHENSMKRPIQDMLSCLLEVKGYTGEQVTLVYDDSILQDTDRQREIDRQEVAAGLLPKWVYIQKWNSLSDEEAKLWVSEIESVI